ncbi:MAG: ribosomal small subunit protein bTHX [Paraglaciecola sp.]|jgi:ribosomal small subunit protein bTHX
MGKGDKRTNKGKITIKSYGKTRNKKTNKAITPKEQQANAEAAKAAE